VWVRRPRSARAKPRQPEVPGPVARALEAAISAAGDKLGAIDAGGLAAARVLAGMVDNAARPAYDDEGRQRPLDNVTLPTFLKYLDAYGLTVAARKQAEAAASGKSKGGRPTGLASVRGLLPQAG